MRLRRSKSVYVPGFKAGGIACGIKSGGVKDLSLIYSDLPAVAAGVFTRNQVRAPSVEYNQALLNRGRPVRAVIVNSGNANACTGPQGMRDCETVAQAAARALGVDPGEVLLASTGVIGVPLPTGRILHGLNHLVNHMASRSWPHAAEGILTTDLVPKMKSVEYTRARKKILIGGIAKGSGMIAPNMATMLGFLATNAAISPAALQKALSRANEDTFNRITVDGACSTNDLVLVLANGKAGNPRIQAGSGDYEAFVDALTTLCRDLAFMIVRDGEGATKFVTITVNGARSRAEAAVLGQAVADSLLVKTALFGADPNWGRIMGALGQAGVPFDPERVDIAFNRMPIVRNGHALPKASMAHLRKKMKCREIEISIHLHQGKAVCKTYTCDLSYDYVRINAEYTT